MSNSSRSSRAILCLDIGSSSCKAVLFNGHGIELASGRGNYSIYYTGMPGEVEQKPEELWNGVCEAVSQALNNQKVIFEIAAISISSQMSSYFLIDKENRPLCDVISWMDTRAVKEAEEMKETFKPEELFRLLGAELPVGPSWPIPKLLWMSRHIPAVLEKAKYLIQPKEWIVWKLTSQWRTDLSSVRGMIHQASGIIAKPLFEWVGIGPHLLPPLGEPFEAVGPLRPDAALSLSLPAGIPVVLGWNDLNAAVLGAVGTSGEVRGFDITGTSEHIGIIQPAGFPNERVIYKGINRIPFDRGHEMYYGVTSSGGQALKWFVEQIDQYNPSSRSRKVNVNYDKVLHYAKNVGPGSGGLIFLPYLNGERSPWWNPSARGVFFGLHNTHDRRHMARSVMEGVGYALRTIMDRLPSVPARIISAGGSGRMPFWNQIKANILGIPISCLGTSEAGCLGAAILAVYGLGWYGSLEEACLHMIRTEETFEPEKQHQSIYEDRYQIFNELYHTLIPIFDKQQRLNP